jgi:predicted metal-binding membrane protein
MADSQVQTWHRALLIGSVGLVSLAAWIMVWHFGTAMHNPVHHHHAGTGPAFVLVFVGSWTVMTMAMMLPTSVPLMVTFQTIAGDRADRTLLLALLATGYVAIWGGVGLAYYAAATLLHRWAANSTWLQAHALATSGLLLIVAGMYQFSPLKYRCLDKCRSPLSFVLGYWQGQHDRRNAFRLGVHHGLFCIGCCWALMLLMFAVGIGNIVGMLLLGAVMAIEKNVPWGRRISAPLGGVLVAGGLAVFVLS